MLCIRRQLSVNYDILPLLSFLSSYQLAKEEAKKEAARKRVKEIQAEKIRLEKEKEEKELRKKEELVRKQKAADLEEKRVRNRLKPRCKESTQAINFCGRKAFITCYKSCRCGSGLPYFCGRFSVDLLLLARALQTAPSCARITSFRAPFTQLSHCFCTRRLGRKTWSGTGSSRRKKKSGG